MTLETKNAIYTCLEEVLGILMATSRAAQHVT